MPHLARRGRVNAVFRQAARSNVHVTVYRIAQCQRRKFLSLRLLVWSRIHSSFIDCFMTSASPFEILQRFYSFAVQSTWYV